MKTLLRQLVILTSLAAALARADILFDTSGQLVGGDPTQLGRLSRNGIPQDWAGSELFPGVINPTTGYHYTTYTINAGITPFIQIDFDSISVNTFVSAYDIAYAPDSAGLPNLGFDVNWLGDAGFSGNPAPGDPLFFNVIAPINTNLIVVINDTSAAGAGLGQPFQLAVEGYLDSSFTSTPEPSSLLLFLGVVSAMFAAQRWKRSSAVGRCVRHLGPSQPGSVSSSCRVPIE